MPELTLTSEEADFVSRALADAKDKIDEDLEYARMYGSEYDASDIEQMKHRRAMYEKLEDRINEQGN